MSVRFAVAALCIVFVPTLLLGAAFPLALRLCVGQDRVGRDVGAVVAFNTLGGIIGVMLCGFLLIPLLGLVRTLGLLALIAAAVGVIAISQGRALNKGTRQGVIAVAVLSLGVAVLTPVDKLASLLPGARNGELAFYQEGRGGTVAVVTQGKQPLTIHRRDGTSEKIVLTCRIDTAEEVGYFKNGGVLHYVLRNLAQAA